jgi:hypothetical protein
MSTNHGEHGDTLLYGDLELNVLSEAIIRCAIEVHRELGLLLNFNTPYLRHGVRRVML